MVGDAAFCVPQAYGSACRNRCSCARGAGRVVEQGSMAERSSGEPMRPMDAQSGRSLLGHSADWRAANKRLDQPGYRFVPRESSHGSRTVIPPDDPTERDQRNPAVGRSRWGSCSLAPGTLGRVQGALLGATRFKHSDLASGFRQSGRLEGKYFPATTRKEWRNRDVVAIYAACASNDKCERRHGIPKSDRTGS